MFEILDNFKNEIKDNKDIILVSIVNDIDLFKIGKVDKKNNKIQWLNIDKKDIETQLDNLVMFFNALQRKYPKSKNYFLLIDNDYFSILEFEDNQYKQLTEMKKLNIFNLTKTIL